MHGRNRYSCARRVTPAAVADEASHRATVIVPAAALAVPLAAAKAVARDVHRPRQVRRPNRVANPTADRARVQARPEPEPTARHAALAVAVAKAAVYTNAVNPGAHVGKSRRCPIARAI